MNSPFQKSTILKLGALALAMLPLVACQNMAPSGQSATSAVMCDKCKTVWVNQSGKPALAFRAKSSMTCPDCESAITTFFKSGTLQHHCSHCGGTMTHCERH